MPLTTGLHNIPADDYHADPCIVPSLSKSIAHTLLTKSPLHAWYDHPRLNPHYKGEDSSRFDLGTAAHYLLLCGSDARIAVVDADNWMTKAAKAQRDEARANGLVPILAKHNLALNAMVRAAKKAIAASEWHDVFKAGKPEQTLIWREGETWCRSMIDWLTDDHQIILDYKTTENANPEAWARGHVSQLGYDIQAEFYPRGMYRVFGKKPLFVFLVQEISPPFACSFVCLDEPMREIADGKIERALVKWGNCMKSGKWPGYPAQTCLVSPTAWQLAEHEQWKAIDDLEIKPGDVPPVHHMSDEDAQLSMFAGGKKTDRPVAFKELQDALRG